METAAQTVVVIAMDGALIGLIGIADAIKPDAAEAVARLKAVGISSIMVTGDNEATARAVAATIGITTVRAQMLPDEKALVVRKLQEQGHHVVMVGDGINDAPALTQADVGIAMGAGTDIAIESADVVLVRNQLTAVADARDIGAISFKKTKQNLAIAFGFNGIGVPLAVTGLVQPTWAMIAMISSVSIVLANSFATRLSSGLALEVVRFFTHSVLSTLDKLNPSKLREWAITRTTGAVVLLVGMSFGLGMIWRLH
jgi:P-type E1-E2 ATPase